MSANLHLAQNNYNLVISGTMSIFEIVNYKDFLNSEG